MFRVQVTNVDTNPNCDTKYPSHTTGLFSTATLHTMVSQFKLSVEISPCVGKGCQMSKQILGLSAMENLRAYFHIWFGSRPGPSTLRPNHPLGAFQWRIPAGLGRVEWVMDWTIDPKREMIKWNLPEDPLLVLQAASSVLSSNNCTSETVSITGSTQAPWFMTIINFVLNWTYIKWKTDTILLSNNRAVVQQQKKKLGSV